MRLIDVGRRTRAVGGVVAGDDWPVVGAADGGVSGHLNNRWGQAGAGDEAFEAVNADPQRLARVMNYVQSEFLPALKDLATCDGGTICRNAARDRMTFVERHQRAFVLDEFEEYR